MDLPDTQIRDVWDGPVLEDGRLVYTVTTWQIHPKDGREQQLEQVRHFYGPEGYGYLGTLDAEGVFEPWVPLQVVLPPEPVVGMTWEGDHVKGASKSERSCEILVSDYCLGGIVSVCQSNKDGGVIVLRDHFCPNIGWGGFEALVQLPDAPSSIQMWSEELTRDGLLAEIVPPN